MTTSRITTQKVSATVKSALGKQLNAYSTKAEELEELRKIAERFPEGTYLHALLSDKLINWVAETVGNDFMPDIFGTFEGLAEELRLAESRVADANTARTEANSVINVLNMTLDDQAKKLQDLRKQMEVAHGISHGYSQEVDRLANEVESLEDQVRQLKVEVYDLTHR